MKKFIALIWLNLIFICDAANLDPKVDASQMHHAKDGEETPHTHVHINIDDDDDDDLEHLGGHDVTWDSLSPEQKNVAIVKFFKSLDTNGDSFVSKEELRDEIAKVMEEENVDMANKDFEDADENRDGKISLEEYFETAGHDEEDDEETKMDKFRFKLADKDSSGFLDEDEFKAFMYPYEYPHMREFLIMEVMDENDADSNRELSKDEFFKISTEFDDFDEDEESFNAADADHNGSLNEDELYELLSKSGERLADTELEWLVSQISSPRVSGKWNQEEIADNIIHFVDSNFEAKLLKYHMEL